jgi:hypothetical protein
VFEDKTSAVSFGREFLKLQQEHWGGFEAASRYRLFANILREALAKKIMVMADFNQNDAYVMKRIIKAKDKDINRQLEILQQKSLADLPKSDNVVYKKFRYVDPLFINGNGLARASEADRDFKAEIDDAKRENEKGVRIARLI